MSDVRSLEEVIAAALLEKVKPAVPDFALVIDAEQPLIDAIAAAIREWCLAPEQIERVARQFMWNEDPYAKITGWSGLHADSQADYVERARAALQAVMGDAP